MTKSLACIGGAVEFGSVYFTCAAEAIWTNSSAYTLPFLEGADWIYKSSVHLVLLTTKTCLAIGNKLFNSYFKGKQIKQCFFFWLNKCCDWGVQFILFWIWRGMISLLSHLQLFTLNKVISSPSDNITILSSNFNNRKLHACPGAGIYSCANRFGKYRS